MNGAPLALALAAGMVSVLNPCGFALLPAYVGLFVAGDDYEATIDRRLLRALGAAACVTVGFVAVFTVLGFVLSSVVNSVRQHLPWVTIVLGAALIAAGFAVVGGRSLRLFTHVAGGPQRRGATGMVLFGVVYAVTSLACSIGPFLAITTVAMNRTVVTGLLTYATYATGMGLIIVTLSVGSALARPRPAVRLRRFSRWALPIGGIMMVLAGAYAVWYGRWELAVYRGDLDDDRVVNLGERLRTDLIQVVERVGAARLAALIVASVAAVAAMAALRLRQERQ